MLVTACMLCGARREIDPETNLTEIDWRYQFERGWLCPPCQEINQRTPPVRHQKEKRQP
jgi:hypothetical protein